MTFTVVFSIRLETFYGLHFLSFSFTNVIANFVVNCVSCTRNIDIDQKQLQSTVEKCVPIVCTCNYYLKLN